MLTTPVFACLLVLPSYVSMFCAAFPLAALTAFITNLIEIRMDAHKFLISRRPFPQQASSIGVWFPIMQVRAHDGCTPLTRDTTLVLNSSFLHRCCRCWQY